MTMFASISSSKIVGEKLGVPPSKTLITVIRGLPRADSPWGIRALRPCKPRTAPSALGLSTASSDIKGCSFGNVGAPMVLFSLSVIAEGVQVRYSSPQCKARYDQGKILNKLHGGKDR